MNKKKKGIILAVAQAVNNGYLWHSMKKINTFSVIPRLKKVIASGAIMTVAVVLFKFLGMNVVVNILLSGGIYFLALYLLREPLLTEVKDVLSQKDAVAAI